MFTKLTEKLDSFLEMGVPFYDCIVMKDGRCLYRHSGGFTDAEKTVKVTGKEKYNIYSCTKLITCVAALQFWERGAFSLEDALSDYMPEFHHMTVKTKGGVVPAKNPILIKHLFEMTAGFSYNMRAPSILKCKEETGDRCETRELVRRLAEDPLLFEPGERWEYSLCHDVLGALIEVVSGVSYGEYVRKNIFEPLGMSASFFPHDERQLDEVVDQYVYSASVGVYERNRKNDYQVGWAYESGGAGCISTVEDYVKFMEALRVGGVILKKETIDLMATDRLTEAQKKAYWMAPLGYGYGLGQRCPKDETLSDFGWGGAAGAYYAIDRKRGLTLYLATHVLSFAEYQNIRWDILPIIQKIVDQI